MPNENIGEDPVFELARNYLQDLNILQNIDIYVITQDDIHQLDIICTKHGLKKDITKENFCNVLGEISALINKKLETFVRIDIMQRKREQEPESLPEKSGSETADEPKWEK